MDTWMDGHRENSIPHHKQSLQGYNNNDIKIALGRVSTAVRLGWRENLCVIYQLSYLLIQWKDVKEYLTQNRNFTGLQVTNLKSLG